MMRPALAGVLSAAVAMQCPASLAAAQAGAAPACSAVHFAAALAPGGIPHYPLFELPPAARPASAAVMIDEARREVFIYPTEAPGAGAEGVHLVVADAATGAVLWLSDRGDGAAPGAPIEHAPVLLTDATGLVYRAYAGDLAGSVWRLDLPAGPVAAWTLSRLADLAALAAATGTVSLPAAPDLFRAVDGDGRPFDGVVLAALIEEADGRRIDLLLLRDYAVQPPAQPGPLAPADLTALRGCDAGASGCPPASGPGWHLTDAAPGDALAVAPLIDGGRVFLATHERFSLDCDAGTAVRFATVVDLQSGAGLLGEAGSIALGRQALHTPVPGAGEVRLPGLAAALAAEGLDPGLLTARGLTVRRRYWLDLLLDSD